MLVRTVEISLLSALQWLPSRQTLRCLRRAIHAPFLVRSSTDVVSASIHMLMTHSFISASPHSHLSIVCIQLKSGCHLTYSDSIAIKESSLLWLQMPFSRRRSVSGLLTTVLPPHTWKCTTWCHPGLHTNFGHISSTDTKSAFSHLWHWHLFPRFHHLCPAKTLTSLNMSRIQLPGSLHQHITPTLIYLQSHHTSPKRNPIHSNTCPTSSIHTNSPRFPDATILRKGSPTPIVTLWGTLPPVLLLPLSTTLSHQSSTTPHLRTALKTPKILPLWPPAVWHYYCLLYLVVFVYLERLYINPGYFYYYVQSFLLVKNQARTLKKKMNLTLNLCLHILYLSKTPFSTCLLSRRQWQPQSLQRWALNLEPNDRFILLAANSDLLQNLMLVSRSLWKQKQQMGPSDSPPDLSETPWVCLGRRGRDKKEKGLEWAVAGCSRWALACQLTWWMNQFHINLMLNSYNWIIYTAQRHMGSDHFNPRWALDFCSQAIGLWPAVNNLMLRWLSPANQLTPVTSQCCHWFVQGCVQEQHETIALWGFF